MKTREILNLMESVVYERDRQEFALGDTLDIKTGLILAALTFLAIQSGDFIHAGLSPYLKILQYVSVVSLIFGGIFTVVELYPRDYDRDANPAKYQAWIIEMKQYKKKYPETPPFTAEIFTAARVKSAIQNIQTNQAINKSKTSFMIAAFVCTILAFTANIITLATRLF